ncbi:hypothetical protein J3A78_003503 [Streptomyces sp. PvR006]|uniref:hypothetical protein n=1 Tax=Streptomyces sp. PvR006 TaxID=2817860 RepID=UPI001AE1B110|nr:hypothetical protein [Streptomyces sp. PvR006]MBP2583025.1 hypothetical protein [Streptomyces sp. PvR006]
MLKHTRRRLLAAVTDASAWAHPYADPFTCYADGGDSGGAGDGGTGDDAEDGDGSDDGDDSDDGADGDGDEEDAKLGDKGVKALRELRRENRQLKAQLRQKGARDAAKQPPAKDGDQDGDDNDPEAIRERAREEARAEVWTERVEAAAIAAAAGRLANPNRVAQLLGEDLADIPKDAKGRPDREAISELIDDLLESDPYLAAPATGKGGRRFQGDADGGARKPAKKAAASLGEAVAARLAKNGS